MTKRGYRILHTTPEYRSDTEGVALMKKSKAAAVAAAVCIFALFSTGSIAKAATIQSSSCSQSAVQAAVNSAGVNDTISIPAGNCSWSSPVAWRNKNVKIIGAGKDVTNISCGLCFSVESTATTSAYSQWRVSGLSLKASAPSGVTFQIWDNNGSAHTGWRIDHVKFDKPGSGGGYGIFVGGATYGLIDHNDFNWGNGMAILVSAQMSNESPPTIDNLQGAYLAAQPLDLGTANALYVEDNKFTSTAPNGCAAYDTSNGGGRVVFRHNVLTGCMYYSHWTRNGEIGGILHEIYNNQFIGNSAYNQWPIRLEAGTGVIFNNTMQMASNFAWFDERRGAKSGYGEASGTLGSCDGSKSWDGNAGDSTAPGWPCLGQIGRAPGKSISQIRSGSKQVSAPIYLWNNGTQVGCSTGGSCVNSFGVQDNPPYVKATPHPNGEVDYVLNGSTPKPGYTPYTYPHPLQTAGGTTAPVPAPAPQPLPAPSITSATSASGVVGSAFTYMITATYSPTSFSATGLPPGLSVNTATGVISGTPTTLGSFNATIRASNGSGTGSATLVITISAKTSGSSLFSTSNTPAVLTEPDPSSVELGVRFYSAKPGKVRGIRFYKGPKNTGTHGAHLWTGSGAFLAGATFVNETASGWQTATFNTPVPIEANKIYVASYRTAAGYYSVTEGFFSQPYSKPPLATQSNAGVYTYGTGALFPSKSYNGSNYWVDVLFSE